MPGKKPERIKPSLAARLNNGLSKEAQRKGHARGRICFDYLMGTVRRNARLEVSRKSSVEHSPERLLKKCFGQNSEKLANLDTLTLIDSFYRTVQSLGPEERDCAISSLRDEIRKEKERLTLITERLKQKNKFEDRVKIVINAQQRALETMEAEMNLRKETGN